MITINVSTELATALRTAIFFAATGCRDFSSKVVMFSDEKLETLGLTRDMVFEMMDLNEEIMNLQKKEHEHTCERLAYTSN